MIRLLEGSCGTMAGSSDSPPLSRLSRIPDRVSLAIAVEMTLRSWSKIGRMAVA